MSHPNGSSDVTRSSSANPAAREAAGQSVRLLHASDLHLERVPSGLAYVPDHLRDRLVSAPYAAAARVFETAVTMGVHAVLLAGDVVDLSLAGPRAVVFLREQFERLAAAGIDIYWAGGHVDPPRAWPEVAPLPPNVHVFPVERVETFDLHRDGTLLARIAGASSGDTRRALSQFVPHPGGPTTVAVACGRYTQAELADQQVPYVALGGRHRRKSFVTDDRLRCTHYPGATQGISPGESGPHGCTLATIDEDGSVRTRAVRTDIFRWQYCRIAVDEAASLADVARALIAAAEELRGAAEGTDLLVRWQVVSSGAIVDALRGKTTLRALLDDLRTRFGNPSDHLPCVWSVDLEARRQAAPEPAHFEQDTILGDVLREIRTLQEDPHAPLDLAACLAAADRNSPLAERLVRLSRDQRREILDQTTEECMALLSGREAPR